MATSQSLIEMPNHLHETPSNVSDFYCSSWRLSIETNNAGYWNTSPSNCSDYVKDYMAGDHYLSDSEMVCAYSLAFAQISGASKGFSWVFDIDETLLSHNPYSLQGKGNNLYEKSMDIPDAPALPASLKFYKELLKMNYTIFLLTGRPESYRNITVENLLKVGYSNWERLIMRGDADEGKKAIVYKSEKRQELVNEGYRLHGNTGDQWSDLLGFAVAERSFKLPNPMYYIA
ncbi:acid phosphatase 1-like [Euphorbia lathyris]|uniref:acid phosphatase 1-like n=1 Tax=Euphorbia lathyris TaxID=212925 RepID=UPI003313B172